MVEDGLIDVAGQDKHLIRQRALVLYEFFRNSSAVTAKRAKKDDEPMPKIPARPFLDGATAAAYMTGVMPSIYGATMAVLQEARHRFELADHDRPPWRPQRIVDWGAGLGSVAWYVQRLQCFWLWADHMESRAAHEVWPEHKLAYVGLDSSRAMQMLASNTLQSLSPQFLERKLIQISLSAPEVPDVLANSFPDISHDDTMAVAAFTLGDLSDSKVRREVVRSMWDSKADVIVIIDRGTPNGFDIIAQARDQLLRLGRHASESVIQLDEQGELPDEDAGQHDVEEIRIGNEIFVAQNAEVQATGSVATQGCYVIAPVSHRAAGGMLFS